MKEQCVAWLHFHVNALEFFTIVNAVERKIHMIPIGQSMLEQLAFVGARYDGNAT